MLQRREREGERSPEGGAAAESAVVRPQPAPTPPAAHDDHFDERRWREAGGPQDRAQYACACGYLWETTVSASVACPNCGSAQAW
jgi:rubrerythrin